MSYHDGPTPEGLKLNRILDRTAEEVGIVTNASANLMR